MKRLLQTLAAEAALTLLFATVAFGGTIVINFDTDPLDDPVPNGTAVDSLYSTMGVTFSATNPDKCGGSVFASDQCSAPAVSAPNVVTLCNSGCADIAESSWGLVRADLTEASSAVCVDFVPAEEGELGVLRAYDAVGNLLDTAVSSGGPETLWVTVAGIRRVEFSGLAGSFGFFDNLSFETGSVPVEPTTFGAVKARAH